MRPGAPTQLLRDNCDAARCQARLAAVRFNPLFFKVGPMALFVTY